MTATLFSSGLGNTILEKGYATALSPALTLFTASPSTLPHIPPLILIKSLNGHWQRGRCAPESRLRRPIDIGRMQRVPTDFETCCTWLKPASTLVAQVLISGELDSSGEALDYPK